MAVIPGSLWHVKAKVGGSVFLQQSKYRRRSRFGGVERKEQRRFDSLHLGQIKIRGLEDTGIEM